MSLPEGFVEELRNSVPLSKIILNKVKLEKRGKNFIGLCPFHKEKTPSFNVVDNEGYYHCFGCGAHGDLITFIRNTENLSFIEAINKIAQISGINIPVSNKFIYDEKINKYKTQLNILEKSSHYYHENLYSNEGLKSLKYFYSRGLSDKIIKEFRLGYAFEKGIVEKLISEGFSQSDIIEAGLLRNIDKNKVEVFKNRIIFPIFNVKSQVVGFGGRTITNSKIKYINSPNSEIFQKSKTLYGFPQALNLKKNNLNLPLLIVEGYMDVISIHSSGIALSLASLGTALNNYQIQQIWKLNNKPILCFDNDVAGRNAALRVIKNVLPVLEIGYEINIILLPENTDPDDMIKGGMSKKFEEIISKPKSLVRSIWELLSDNYDVNSPDQRASFWHETKKYINYIKDKNIKESYYHEVLILINKMKKSNVFTNLETKNSNFPFLSGQSENLKAIFFVLINHPKLYLNFSEELSKLILSNNKHVRILEELFEFTNNNNNLENNDFKNHLNNIGFGKIIEEISDKSVIRRIGFNPEEIETNDFIKQYFKRTLSHALEILQRNKKNF